MSGKYVVWLTRSLSKVDLNYYIAIKIKVIKLKVEGVNTGPNFLIYIIFIPIFSFFKTEKIMVPYINSFYFLLTIGTSN